MKPSDFGKAVTSGVYSLVSYLEGPLRVGSLNEYVVFATAGPDIATYAWDIRPVDAQQATITATTSIGVFAWRPEAPGDYVVRVMFPTAAASIVLEMRHRVVLSFPIDPAVAAMLKDEYIWMQRGLGRPVGNIYDAAWRAFTKHCASIADGDVTQEIAAELWLPIFDAAHATGPTGVPALLLAGVLFNEVSSRPKEWTATRPYRVLGYVRKNEIETYANWINGGRKPVFGEGTGSLGVGQMKPSTAASVLGLSPLDEDPDAKKDELAYEALDLETRIDIFNLLRFPRTNVALAARYLALLKNRAHRFPTVAAHDVIKTPNAVEVLASEYNRGPRSAPLAELERIKNDNARVIRDLVRAPYLTAFYSLQPHVATDYGALDLRVGDRDGTLYAGAPPPDTSKTYIRNVARDLVAMGFAPASAASTTGVFDDDLEWVVRELQAYMKMDFVARLRPDVPATNPRTALLRSYANVARYDGPVSGVLNVATRRTLRVWRNLGLHCPLVISAWNNPTGANTLVAGADNLWHASALTNSAPRMRAQDYSNYFDIPDAKKVDERIDLGYYFFDPTIPFGGGQVEAKHHVWFDTTYTTELLPKTLAGFDATQAPTTDADRQERSTYKVVRAAAEQECEAYFDVLNAWDNAVVSLGPCHWTLALIDMSTHAVGSGELCGFFAYLERFDRPAFDQLVGFFGLGVVDKWGSSTLFDPDQRKYTTWLTAQSENYSMQPIVKNEAHTLRFRSWPWFYRLQSAGRTINRFRTAMWRMARIRIRDILATPWPGTTNAPTAAGGGVPKIGDVYTSERAIALLLRWHIWRPAHVVRPASQSQTTCLQSAFNVAHTAGLPTAMQNWVTPQRTADQVEEMLIAGLEQIVNATGNPTFAEVSNWPRWEGGSNPKHYQLQPSQLDNFDDQPAGQPNVHRRLRKTRNSFQMWPLQADEA